MAKEDTVMLKYCCAPALTALLVVPPAVAAQSQTGVPPRDDQPRAEQPRAEQPRADQARTDERRQEHEQKVIRADRLIGQAVHDRGDERVGRINDLAFHVNDKKVTYAVISRGGLFGIGAEDVAVAWDQLRPDMAERVVRADAQTVQQARRIDTRTAWPTDITRAGEPAAEQPVGTAGRDADAGHIVSMSRIIGMDVRNQQGERLGQIDDIALNPDGSIAYAVVAHGGFLGMGHNYVAVPWDRMTFDRQQERITLDVTQQQLENARSFEYRDRWPDRVDWPFGN
jgi:sporulation protein YlmC with PRC-barrel domain